MNLSAIKRKEIIFLVPYLLLLMLGAWYRYHISGMIYLEDDSDHYLLPAIRKAVTGEWHKGERPMQYLLFIYYTLSKSLGIARTIVLQQVLGILSAGFLTVAWVKFVSGYSNYKWLWYLVGYMMIGVYISSPAVMYYEQLLAPESFCIFVMSVLICCLVFIFSEENPGGILNPYRVIFIPIAIFINLYLANPMTKWVLSSVFLEVLLLYVLIKQPGLSKKKLVSAIVLPHLLYILIVWIPELTHKTDQPNEVRAYIEYEQMAYTHFDLLAQDKTNFGLTPALQDSMIEYFIDAAMPEYMVKFNYDALMWGKASALVNRYYNNNYDSIEQYYLGLNVKLLTRYPLGLAGAVGKQVLAFYVPNYVIHKDLFNCVDFTFSYNENARIMNRIEPAIIGYIRKGPYYLLVPVEGSDSTKGWYQISPAYPYVFAGAKAYNINRLPLLFPRGFWFYRFFSPLFLAVMIAFFAIRAYTGKLLKLHVITLLHVLIFIYVLTVAVVHTFDCTRFVITIYPFLIITTCMGLVYVAGFVLYRAR